MSNLQVVAQLHRRRLRVAEAELAKCRASEVAHRRALELRRVDLQNAIRTCLEQRRVIDASLIGQPTHRLEVDKAQQRFAHLAIEVTQAKTAIEQAESDLAAAVALREAALRTYQCQTAKCEKYDCIVLEARHAHTHRVERREELDQEEVAALCK